MGIVKSMKERIYSDYFMPSRLAEYDKLIKQLCEDEYQHLSYREYAQKLESNTLNDGKYFINRHDIDTDITTAKEFFKIEKKYNVKASYYFRLSTLDFNFMKEIEAYGSEASYHFEEIAQYCKDNHIKSKDEIFRHMVEIKNIFLSNFRMIEKKLGYKLQTVCSHGDFINRKLSIVNNEITKDMPLRLKLGIICETYDENIMESFDIYVSDKPYPIFYSPKSVFNYIGNQKRICMLSHPRQWKKNIIANTKDNINRLIEGFRW